MSDSDTPKMPPDGKPVPERKDTDETNRSTVGETHDPAIPGDGEKPGYGNSGEAHPDADGLVREGERDAPLI